MQVEENSSYIWLNAKKSSLLNLLCDDNEGEEVIFLLLDNFGENLSKLDLTWTALHCF